MEEQKKCSYSLEDKVDKLIERFNSFHVEHIQKLGDVEKNLRSEIFNTKIDLTSLKVRTGFIGAFSGGIVALSGILLSFLYKLWR